MLYADDGGGRPIKSPLSHSTHCQRAIRFGESAEGDLTMRTPEPPRDEQDGDTKPDFKDDVLDNAFKVAVSAMSEQAELARKFRERNKAAKQRACQDS